MMPSCHICYTFGEQQLYAKISHVISGTILFYALLSISLTVINKMMPEGNLSEVVRIIITYGVILYALTKVGGNE